MAKKRGGNVKLNPDLIKEIRHKFKLGWRQHELATRYKISQQAVSLIVQEKRWMEIPNENIDAEN